MQTGIIQISKQVDDNDNVNKIFIPTLEPQFNNKPLTNYNKRNTVFDQKWHFHTLVHCCFLNK